jgi:segregation and condensation protein B
MAFNLKLVLKALLFSSNQPLTIKDIQAVFTRFHEKAQVPASLAEGSDAAEVPADDAEVAAAALNPVEGSAEAGIVEGGALSLTPEDPELYSEVPALITSTQIREAMDALAAELRAANDIYLLIDGASGYRLVTHPRFARWIRILRDEPPPVKLSQSALETLAVVAYRQPVTRSELESIRGVSAEAGVNRLLEREMIYVVGRADLPGRPLQYGTTDKFLEFVGVKSLVELPASDVLSPRQIDEWLNHTANVPAPSDAEMGLPLEEGEAPSPLSEPVTLEPAGLATEPAAPDASFSDTATPDAPPEGSEPTPKPQPSADNA